MKNIMIVILVFFSGYCIFSMNSTENRQELVGSPVSKSFLVLNMLQQGLSFQDPIVIKANELYLDLLKNQPSRHDNDQEARSLLVSKGICQEKNEKLELNEYYIDDELPKLQRASRTLFKVKP